MELAVIWILFTAAIGFWATKKGRSWLIWGFFSLLLSPLIAAIFLAIADNKKGPAEEQRNMHITHSRCPECRELVRRDASKCKHCGAQLEPKRVAF